jgi:hypothetical protein
MSVLSVVMILASMAAVWALSTTSLHRKLKVIHALVNSNMTAHMQSELEATVRELTMMREVARLHQEAGRAPTEETLSAIDLTQARVAELRAVLGDRFAIQDASPT